MSTAPTESCATRAGHDRLGRVRVHLLAVERQELQHGRQCHLLVAAPQRLATQQRVQQDSSLPGQPTGTAARPRLSQGTFGGGRIEQVKHLGHLQPERPGRR